MNKYGWENQYAEDVVAVMIRFNRDSISNSAGNMAIPDRQESSLRHRRNRQSRRW